MLSDNSFASNFTYIHDSKRAVKCEGDCLKQGKGSFTCTNEANVFITHKLDA